MGGFTPLVCPKIGFWFRGGIFLSPTLIIFWAWTVLKIWAQSNLVEFLADFGGFYPLFCPKIDFWFGGGVIFCHHPWSFAGPDLPWKFELNQTYGWGCGYLVRHGMEMGKGTGTGTGTAGDYIDNLSPSFCLTWLGLALALAEVCQKLNWRI